MNSREKLVQSILAIEKQRSALGPEATETVLSVLNASLKELETPLPRTGERKHVTIMFADISGFTALSEKTDPEDVRTLINAAFERLVTFIEQNGGTVEKFIGDEIMAIFGAPVAHENDAERAVLTALEMMSELQRFSLEHGLNLGMHIGVNTGAVIAGMLGTQQHQQYGVMGDTVNLASRLEDASERGQILVGPETFRQTEALFDYLSLAPIQVKGKTHKVRIFQVQGIKVRAGHPRGLEAQGLRSPMLGRADQLAALLRHIERAATGKGGIVGIIADAGLGKSRLVAEARQAGNELPVRWLEGRSSSFGQAISYGPVRELIRQAVEISDVDDRQTAWEKLEKRITLLAADEAPEILPPLASLLALPIPASLAENVPVEAEALNRQIILSVRRALELLAAVQPVVLVLEDAQWADESSVTLLKEILLLVTATPLLIVVAVRPEFQTPGGRLLGWIMQEYREHFTALWLEPLSHGESVELLHNLVSLEALPVHVYGTILQRAEGNPFYIEEVIRAFMAMGAIVRDPATQKWQYTAQEQPITLPDSIQGIIMARVDRLDERLKSILRTAAVIGRAFPYRILHALDPENRQLGEYLDELKELELIRVRSSQPELVFVFKSMATGEAIYESILLRERKLLHGRIGQTIEKLAGDQLEALYSNLAYHYARADNWEKAQEFLLKAGDQAQQMAADAEALAHYRQALTVYGHIQGAQWNPLDRARLELKMAEAYFRRGEHAQAAETLQEVLAATGGNIPIDPQIVRREALKEGGIQLIRYFFPAYHRPRPGWLTNEVLELRCRTLELLAWIDVWNDPLRSALETLQLLGLAEMCQSAYWEQIGAAGAGYMFSLGGQHKLAQLYHTRSIRLAEKLNQPASLASAHIMAGSSALLAAQWESCLTHYRRAIHAFEVTSDLRGKGLALISMGIARRNRGEYALSMDLSRQDVHLGRQNVDAQVLGWGLHGLGLIGWMTASVPDGEAISNMEAALDAYRSIPDYSGSAQVLGNLGVAYLRQGKLKRAIKLFDDALETIQAKGVRAIHATSVYNGLAQAYLYAAEKELYPNERSGWLRKAHQACAQALRHGKVDLGGLAEAQRLQGNCEWLRGNQAVARAWWKRSIETARRQAQPYETALTYIELGEHMHWREYLSQAELSLQKLGALYDLERVQKLQDDLQVGRS